MSGAWLDIAGAAEQLGVSRRWLENAVAARQVPHHRLGKHVRFTPGDLAAIERATAVPPQNAPRPIRATA